tara:strand:+ start:563 stop:838 length:276 start_codon:yes stop_codon:yes gene_type:complete
MDTSGAGSVGWTEDQDVILRFFSILFDFVLQRRHSARSVPSAQRLCARMDPQQQHERQQVLEMLNKCAPCTHAHSLSHARRAAPVLLARTH